MIGKISYSPEPETHKIGLLSSPRERGPDLLARPQWSLRSGPTLLQ